MAEYRLLDAYDQPLVGDVPLEPASFEASLRNGEGASLAAFEDGVAVSSVHVFVREVRDRSGRPLRVGRVSNVIRPWGHWAVFETAGDAAHLPVLFGATAVRLRRMADS